MISQELLSLALSVVVIGVMLAVVVIAAAVGSRTDSGAGASPGVR